MKIGSWTATVLATPAIATGVGLLCAGVAQAAPDDTSSSSHSSSSSDSEKSTTDSSSPSTGRDTDGDDTDKRDSDKRDSVSDRRDADDDEPNRDEDPDVDEAAEADADDPTDAASTGPHYVPASVRDAEVPESLVTLDAVQTESLMDTVDDDETDVDDEDEDVPGDDEDDEAPAIDTVELALQQISQARDDLNAATWDSGNILAGLAAILPQMMLGGAQANLERWQENHALLQARYAATADDPFAHFFAGIRLENSMYRPIRAQDQLDLAEKLIPVVGWFGPRDAAAAIKDLVHEARDNGLVYEIIRLEMQYNGQRVRTEPIIHISVNGGERVAVLVDTGSRGLLIDPRYVGVDGIGGHVGPRGEASYGDGSVVTYFYPYETTIEVGSDITTAPTQVLIVELESVQGFTDYNGDYVGVLGIGPNSGGPGTTNPFVDLPGMLNQGVLFDERRRRLILGPNPYAARVTVDGAPSSQLTVKVGDYAPQVVDTWVDSGGILGDIPDFVVDGATSIPVGTLISVYTEDGETLLYSYRTTRANNPGVVDGDNQSFVNTGYVPFSLGTLYFSYAGQGTTTFNYA